MNIFYGRLPLIRQAFARTLIFFGFRCRFISVKPLVFGVKTQPEKMHFLLLKFTNNNAQFMAKNNKPQKTCTYIIDNVLQFCSIFSLFLQNRNISLVLFKSYIVYSFKTLKFQTIDTVRLVENSYDCNKN